MVDGVPVIDLAPSFSAGPAGPAGRQRVAEAIRDACEGIGFFTIIGHGIPEALGQRLETVAKRFFALPLSEKNRTPQPPEKISRGYSYVGSRGLAYSTGVETPPDLQESFAMGAIDEAPPHVRGTDAERYFFQRNIWPPDHPDFREAFEDYYRAMDGLARHIMSLFARALGLADEFFDDKIDQPTSTMRVIHYPPQIEPPKPGQLRSGVHTDYGTVTVLKGDDVPGGLQMKHRGGGWVDVHPRPDSFVCNIGDLMMRWTNDKWISNPHRVANPPREHAGVGRVSIPFFHNPNVDAEIRCIRAFYGENEPEKYPPVRWGDYYLSKHMKAQHMTLEKLVAGGVAG